MSTATQDKTLTTADLAATGQVPAEQQPGVTVAAKEAAVIDKTRAAEQAASAERARSAEPEEEQLAALFADDAASDFRGRWDAVQIAFVDDPRQAVRQADELVAQVMKSLAESFAGERARIESQFIDNDGATTETLRLALRRYRSFFQRLLAL
jgi:hypothetical protein